MASLDTNISTFNLLATPTTIVFGAGASVALTIGHASAAALFPGGISIPTGKTLSLNSEVVGVWTTPTFSAANFTASGSQTWTVQSGDVAAYQYTVINKIMILMFSLNATTVGGTPNTELRITIPGGYTADVQCDQLLLVNDNIGGWVVGKMQIATDGTYVTCYKDLIGVANWTASTNNTYILGQAIFAIN